MTVSTQNLAFRYFFLYLVDAPGSHLCNIVVFSTWIKMIKIKSISICVVTTTSATSFYFFVVNNFYISTICFLGSLFVILLTFFSKTLEKASSFDKCHLYLFLIFFYKLRIFFRLVLFPHISRVGPLLG